ncbi:MAG: hypothetical protein NTZ78_06980 [Candidatus Aureabacteria bacterium]|nr:hypothetical protein [Candidatus Auribacterota bacterium]
MSGRTCIPPSSIVLCCLVLAVGLCGCDRVKELFDKLADSIRPSSGRKAEVSDKDRILRKFGQPRERLGVGKTVHTENGIRYNRKWNYYYSGKSGEKPLMRTVYFIDDAFTGSAVHQADGTVRKEDIRFAY